MVPFGGLAQRAASRKHSSETETRSCAPDTLQPETPMHDADEPAPFHSAESALRFALSREGQPGRPLASRMTDASGPRGSFVGLDAAAQAGMILAAVQPIGPVKNAVLRAKVAPSAISCSCRRTCCRGWRPNPLWQEAIGVLAYAATSLQICAGAQYRLRHAIIAKVCAEEPHHRQKAITLAAIAAELDLDVEAVSGHHRAIVTWLRGKKAGRDGSPPIEGLINVAWQRAEDVLRDAGIVE